MGANIKMSETIDGEVVEVKPAPGLTVSGLIKDMAMYPPDAPVFAALEGIGMTIYFTGCYKMETKEIGDIVVLQVQKEGAIAALEYHMKLAPVEGETTN